MSELELKFLGGFEVRRDGIAVPLPPSKKTRALLAYLSLNPRRFRREFLCELLWEIPDDPRGSLRWSLSKLRRLVDDEERTRIVADRNGVEFDATDVGIDVKELCGLVQDGLDGVSSERLEEAARRLQGNFLEDLELSNFYDFHAWCAAQRDQVVRCQEAILRNLLGRIEKEPARALPFARDLVSLAPYSEADRAILIRLLVSLRRRKEAEEQYRMGIRMLEEVNERPTGAMLAALRSKEGLAQEHAETTPDAAADVRISDDRLIGRQDESARLLELYNQARRDKRAICVLLSGEPGIGKSRLMKSLAAAAEGSDVCLLRAGAYESEAIRPFALWTEALGQHDPTAVGKIFTDRDIHHRDFLFDGLSDYVTKESLQRPVVLMFDDMHWCDESSAAALHYAARMNRDRPLFALLSARAGELRDNVPVQQALRGLSHDGLLTELKVGPLSRSEVKELIEQVAPSAESDALSRECGGNPLLAIELARAKQSGDSGHSLSELIKERLARLDAEGVEVLRWAALLSPRIDTKTLAEVAQVDADRVGAALEAAERQAVLVLSGDGPRFSHDLVARAVYNDISPVRRQIMHRRIAELVELNTKSDLRRAADLAHHATHSGDPALAARSLASAGLLSLRYFANDEALALSRKGLEIAEQLEEAERVCVSIDLHNVRLSAAPLDDWRNAASQYVELAEQALDHGHRAHARLGYQMASYVRWAHGQWSGAREESLQAARAARGGTPEDQIVGLSETARCLAMLERDLSQADAMLMEAKGMAERLNFNHQAIPLGAGMLRFHQNDLDQSQELFMEARMLCKSAGERIGEYQANEYLVMIDIQRECYADAIERCRELKRIGDKLREGSEAPFARSMEGLCVYALENDSGPLDAALQALRASDAKHRLAYAQTRAALLDISNRNYEKAIERATEALECASVLERPTEVMLARSLLAHALRATGCADDADVHAFESRKLDHARVAVWAREVSAVLEVQFAEYKHG